MAEITQTIASFGLVALAAVLIGRLFLRFRLPLITGFLLTGMLAGGSLLGIVTEEEVRGLRFLDQIALSFIAFAAGGELFLRDLKGRFRNIAWVTGGLVASTFLLGSLTVYLLSGWIPLVRDMPPFHRAAVAALAGAILVARSPSSAIALIRELRARGPFTRTVLGVTVIMDVVVIVIFAGNSAFADAALTNVRIGPGFALLLLFELALSVAFGLIVGWTLNALLALPVRSLAKSLGVLAVGYGVYLASGAVRSWTHGNLGFEVLLEPLFVCMVGGFYVTNRTEHRLQFSHLLRDTGPPIFVLFFTLTGASLDLALLTRMWTATLVVFGARLGAIAVGTFAGGTLSRAPASHNRVSWMAFVTQAGVGLGLAKQVAVSFPEWGESFATLLVSVIILNQVVGPPLLKWALHRVGEANPPAEEEGDGRRKRALIVGLEANSLALAFDLERHGWEVKIASRKAKERRAEELGSVEVDIEPIRDIGPETLRKVGADHVSTIIAMLSDEEDLEVCRIAAERFGIENRIAVVHDREKIQRFREAGILVIEPDRAVVGLLSHLVRSPSATSLLLGFETDQTVVEVEVRAAGIHGTALRDLRLPLDVLVLSVRRDGRSIVSHGFTRLERGDRVTVVGERGSLEEVARRFEE